MILDYNPESLSHSSVKKKEKEKRKVLLSLISMPTSIDLECGGRLGVAEWIRVSALPKSLIFPFRVVVKIFGFRRLVAFTNPGFESPGVYIVHRTS